VKLLALIFIVPAIVTVVVGIDFLLRGTGIGELHIPRSGLWALFVGGCCLATGWVAKQGLTALWKKL
jgi:uncharacterized membrane protein